MEERREGVVGVDHRDAVVGQRLVDRALGLGDAPQAAHALHVRRRDVVHQRHLRRHDRSEVGDVARLARAHFVHGELRVLRRVEHGQRQADLVVAIARVAVGAAGSREHAGDQRLHRGLAIAAGERDHDRGASLLHASGDLAQRFLGVGAEHARQLGLHVAMQQQRGGAVGGGLRGEIVAVEVLAAQRHEQRARRQLAAVGGDGLDRGVGAQVPAFGPGGELRERDRPHARASSSSFATLKSSKGVRTPLISW